MINVIRMPADGEVSISTQVKLYYDDEKGNHVNPGESHDHPNHVLWNFGESAAHINIGSGHFMGSLLAPNAHVTAGVNVDGNIIANIVDIRGGESHKWDIHPVEPPSFIVIPDPTETPQPTSPTSPTSPTEQPTDPQPSDPIIVVQTTVDRELAGTTNPGGNKEPKPQEETKGDDDTKQQQ